METVRRAGGAAGVRPLETSLVEWKRAFGGEKLRIALALETSLVEWKHWYIDLSTSSGTDLGNFLSGMETVAIPREGAGVLCLGNFLSGMETIQLRWPLPQPTPPWKLP